MSEGQGAMTGANDAAMTGAGNTATSAGAMLREARERRGWSQDEVSIRLKFGVRQIAALEDERWSDLPHGMSLRGFVRNYARVLDIPPEPLLQAMGPRLETGDPVSLAQASSLSSPLAQSGGRDWPKAGRKRPAPWIIGGFMLLVAIALVAYALTQQGALSVLTGTPKPSTTALAPVAPATESTEPVAPPNTTPTGSNEPLGVIPGTPAPPVAAAVPPPVATPEPAAAAAPAATNADGLVIRTREASWIDVRRANGTVAISQIVPPNTDVSVEASAAPLRIVIGNVKGVDAQWRRAPLDMSSARRDNVARMTLN
jgi:cytoskeleton protein RodZ